MNILSVDGTSMCYIEDFYDSLRVVDRVNDSIVTNSNSIIIRIKKFMTSEKSRMRFKRKYLGCDSILNDLMKLFKLALCACCYIYGIFCHFCLNFFKNARKLFTFSVPRFIAIAKSMMSWRIERSWMIVNKKAFCSFRGSALKAVKNTSAVACLVVMLCSFCSIKYSLEDLKIQIQC